MIPLRIALIAVLLLPPAAAAQTEELPPPPLPSESEVASPPTSEAPVEAPSESPGSPPEPSAEYDHDLDSRATDPRFRSTEDPGRPLRITSEVVGGMLGSATGGLLGYLGGVALFCAGGAPQDGGDYCPMFGILTAIPAAWAGLGLGTWGAGTLMEGQGIWWAPMLGSAVGGVVAWLGGSVISGLVYQSPPLAIVLGVLVGSMPVVGAVVGYELSHGAELQRAFVPTAIAPLLTPELKGVALAWAF